MASSYDELEPWYEHLYPVLHGILTQALAPERPGAAGRALDAGCGTGYQAAHLAKLGYEPHGVDIAFGLLGVARRRGTASVLATIESLPYADASFDVVACCGSTLSFVEAPGLALAELGRVLRPGGRLLLECEHRWNLDLLWAALSAARRDWLGYGRSPREALTAILRPPREAVVVEYPAYGRLRLFTLTGLRRELRKVGLSVERAWGIHMTTNLIPSTVLHRPVVTGPLASLYRRLCALDDVLRRVPGTAHVGNNVVVLARKPLPETAAVAEAHRGQTCEHDWVAQA